MTASLEIQALAQEWAADREAMADERREALLDWVREQYERVLAGLGFHALKRAVEFTADSIADLLSFLRTEAWTLCEEAGL